MCALRVHRHAKITKPDCDRVEREGHRTECLVEVETVIGRLGLRQRRELAGRGPVKLARIHHGPARHCSVAGEILGRGVHNEGRPEIDRAAEVRRGRRVVDDKGQPDLVRELANGVQVGDVATRVGDRLAEDRARVLVDRGLDGVKVVEIHQP